MTEPTTEAGRRLLSLTDFQIASLDDDSLLDIILAIEAEARAVDDLGAAWAEAEATLPEGATIIVARYAGRGGYPACEAVGESVNSLIVRSDATPAAALRAVAAALADPEPKP